MRGMFDHVNWRAVQCVDCPNLTNGGHKRPFCCRDDGRRARAEAVIIEQIRPSIQASIVGKTLARAVAMSGTLLASPAAAQFHPYSWSAGERRLRGKIIG